MSNSRDSRSAASRLLYVEDEAEIAAIAVEVLSDEYDIDLAVDGESALELLSPGATT